MPEQTHQICTVLKSDCTSTPTAMWFLLKRVTSSLIHNLASYLITLGVGDDFYNNCHPLPLQKKILQVFIIILKNQLHFKQFLTGAYLHLSILTKVVDNKRKVHFCSTLIS